MAAKRAGKTVKVSVSLDRAALTALKKYAAAEHAGNLSAAIAEATRVLAQQSARARLIDALGGPSLTPEAARGIDVEQAGRAPTHRVKKPRRAA